MRDLVDVMADRDLMLKVGLKMKFGDNDAKSTADVSNDSESSYGVSEYSVRESHSVDKKYRTIH